MDTQEDKGENSSANDAENNSESLLHNKNAMAAITFTTMNFLWVFPALGAMVILVRNPLERSESGINIEDIQIEHWLSIAILFLQLIFFNGWLMTKRFLPKNKYK